MSIAKKSIKWLVAAIVVFALVLTAVFAVGNVATAAATGTPTLKVMMSFVEVTKNADTGNEATSEFAYLVASGSTRTVRAYYYVEMPTNVEASEPELALSPVLTWSRDSSSESIRPSKIALNPSIVNSGAAAIASDDGGNTATQYKNGTKAAFAIAVAEDAIDEIRGVSYANETYSKITTPKDMYLFYADYELDSNADAGLYTFSMGAIAQGSVNSAVAYALDLEEESFDLYAPVAKPTADTTVTYDGTAHAASEALSTSPVGYTIGGSETNAGSYQAPLTLADYYIWDLGNGNYSLDAQTMDWTIAPKALTVAFNKSEYTSHYNVSPLEDAVSFVYYDGQDVFNLSDTVGVSYMVNDDSTITAVTGLMLGTNDLDLVIDNTVNGNYTITAKEGGDTATYYIVKYVAYIGFDKAEYSATYAGTPDTITIENTGAQISTWKTVDDDQEDNFDFATANAGTYTLHLHWDTNTDYEVVVTRETATYTVIPASITVGFSSATYNATYGTDPATVIGYLLNGVSTANDPVIGNVSLSYTVDDQDANFDLETAPAGTYTVRLQNTSDSNYTVTKSPATATYVIAPQAISIGFNSNSYVTTYGTAASITYVGDGAQILSNVRYVITEDVAALDSTTPAGTYHLTLAYDENSNYTVETLISAATYQVNPKAVTVAFNEASYGSTYGASLATIGYTYTGVINEDTISGVSYTVSGGGTLQNVGSYTLNVDLPAANVNPNYTLSTSGTAIYTISAKAVTVEFDEESYSSTYGEALAAIGYSFTGLLGSDTIPASSVSYSVAPEANLASANVGTYTLTLVIVTAENGNYTISGSDTAPYTINRAANAITFYTIADNNASTTPVAVLDPDTASTILLYGSQTFTVTASGSNGLLQYAFLGDGASTITYYSDNAGVRGDAIEASAVTVGYYWVGVAVDEGTNYLAETDYVLVYLEKAAGAVTLKYRYKTIEEVEALTVNRTFEVGEAIPVTNDLIFFSTKGFVFNDEIVTEITSDMIGQTLYAEILFTGMGDTNGDNLVNVTDLFNLRSFFLSGYDPANLPANANVLTSEAAAWAKCVAYIADTNREEGEYDYILYTAMDINDDEVFNTADIVALREAFATGYGYMIVTGENVAGQEVVTREVEEVSTYAAFVAAVTKGKPVRFTADINDVPTADFNVNFAMAADINLNGHKLIVNSFSLYTSATDATLKFTNGNIVTVEGISIQAPNGNVKISGVNGYTYEVENGTTVTISAADQSLHIAANVGFYVYKDSDYATPAALKAAVAAAKEANAQNDVITAIAEERIDKTDARIQAVEAQKQAIADFEATMDVNNNADIDTLNDMNEALAAINVKKAPISVPVSTHVVVEDAAKLVVDQIKVTQQSDTSAPAVTSFSIEVKSTAAEKIQVDITEVKETVDQVNVYYVESVEVAGEENKVEIITAADQTFAAAIGESKYKTFEAALAAAKSKETITLLADIDYSTTYTVRNIRDDDVPGDPYAIDLRDLTLDLNQHTIYTINGTVSFGGSDATIKNGTFDLVEKNTDGSYKDGSYALIVDNRILPYGVNGKVLVKDVVCDGGFNVKRATVTLENVSAHCTTTKFYVLWAEDYAVLTVNSGTFTYDQTSGCGLIATGSNVALEENGAVIIVNGGTFTGKYKLVPTAEPNSITICGGTFERTGGTQNFDPTAYVPEGYIVLEDDGIYTVVAAAAAIGDQLYLTLQDAIDVAGNGATPTEITLLRDVTDGTGISVRDHGSKNIIIDFNGHTYTATHGAVGSAKTVNQSMHWYDYSTVVLKDGTFVIGENPTEIIMGMQNYAALTVENMVFDFTNLPNVSYPANYGAWTGLERPVFNTNRGSLTMIDSTVILPSWSHYGVTFNTTGSTSSITGSTIQGTVTLISEVDDPADPRVTVTDSTVTGGYVSYFSDYVVVENDGLYSLQAWTVVTTASEFATAIENGGYIQLGADITLAENTSYPVSSTFVLDINGYTLSGSASGTGLFVLSGGADVTITDSATVKGVIENHSAAIYGKVFLIDALTTEQIAAEMTNKLTLKDGVVVYNYNLPENPNSTSNAVISLKAKSYAEILIEDAHLVSSNGNVFNALSNSKGKLTIKDGLFEMVDIDGSYNTFSGGSNLTALTIEGGSFPVDLDAEKAYYSMASWTNKGVTGGTFYLSLNGYEKIYAALADDSYAVYEKAGSIYKATVNGSLDGVVAYLCKDDGTNRKVYLKQNAFNDCFTSLFEMHVCGNAVLDHEFGSNKKLLSTSFSKTKNPSYTLANPQSAVTVDAGGVLSGTAIVKYGTLTIKNYGTVTAEFTCPDRYTLTTGVNDDGFATYSAVETEAFARVVIGEGEPVLYASIDQMLYDLQQVAGGTVTITFISDIEVLQTSFTFKKQEIMVNDVKAYYGPDTVNIVLEDCTITNRTTSALFRFTGASTAYINANFSGSGTLISMQNGASIVYTESYTNVTLEGEEITYRGRNSQAIYNAASYNSIIYITGGTFVRAPFDSSTEDSNLFCNCIDNKRSATVDIVITGGVFYNYDPASDHSDGPSKPVYAPDGYDTSVEVVGDDWIYTVSEMVETII